MEGISFIEMPTYLISIIFFAFLLFSICAEKSIHHILHALRDRPGLVSAAQALMLEIMLVGLISLILTALSESLSSICVPFSSSTFDTWSIVSNVEGCDCCLENTKGVGYCFRTSRNCGKITDDYCNCNYPAEPTCPNPPAFNATLTALLTDPNCTCASEYTTIITEAVEPYAEVIYEETACLDEYPNSPDCADDKAHLISREALEQIHILLFLVAAVHIVMSIIAIMIASYRVRLWNWEMEDSPTSSSSDKAMVLEKEPLNNNSAGDDTEDPPVVLVENGDASSSSTIEQIEVVEEEASATWWKKWLASIKEFGICCALQFNYTAIKKEQYLIMRDRYIETHSIEGDEFSFMEQILSEMELELSHIVGIGLECWMTLIFFILISGPYGWALSGFALVSGIILLLMDAKLVHVIRQLGRSTSSLDEEALPHINAFWYKNPEFWFRPPLRYLIFLCSLTYSIALFFIWQFGARNCYFVNQFDVPGFFGMVWWLSFIISAWIFFNTTLKTVPWYCMVKVLAKNHSHRPLPPRPLKEE